MLYQLSNILPIYFFTVCQILICIANCGLICVQHFVDTTGSNIHRRKMRHKIVTQKETKENIIIYTVFLLFCSQFYTIIHIQCDYFRQLRNINNIRLIRLQLGINRFNKVWRFSEKIYVLRNWQMVD